MRAPRIALAELEQLRITEKTVWTFVRLGTDDGRIGYGEATLPNAYLPLKGVAEDWLDSVLGLPPSRPDIFALSLGRTSLPDAALRSALDTALYDLEGQAKGVPVFELLGGPRRDRIELYANINRATTDRSATGFAKTAERARNCGFTAFKVAPFDELTAAECEGPDFAAHLDKGLARIAATRDAIGPDRTLKIDCHWRFTPTAAATLIDASAPLKPDWIECPIAEKPENAGAIAALRRQANQRGIRLAGLELGTEFEAFAPFLEARAYDVIMPDVKYLGGLARMAELNALARDRGALLSPHNPSGPVCHAASLHVCAALPECDMLEMQFGETPLFDTLLEGPAFSSDGGMSGLPQGPGLGAKLNARCVDDLRIGGSA